MTVAAPPSLQSCLDRLDALRVFPVAALRVLTVVRDPEASLPQVEKALASDPVLAASVLALANSAALARKVPVRSLPRAVQVVGFEGAKRLALEAVVGALAGAQSPWGPLLHRHALLTAMISETIAHRTPLVDASEAYVVGLLHDLGLQLLLRLDPEGTSALMERCSASVLDQGERMRFGFTHAELSALCIREWGLPSSFALVVSGHHGAIPPRREAAASLVLAVADEASDLLADGAGVEHLLGLLVHHPANQVLRFPVGILRELSEAILTASAEI